MKKQANRRRTTLSPRLALSKETVRILSARDLDQVAGGLPSNRNWAGCSTFGTDTTEGDRLSHCACDSD